MFDNKSCQQEVQGRSDDDAKNTYGRLELIYGAMGEGRFYIMDGFSAAPLSMAVLIRVMIIVLIMMLGMIRSNI